MEAKGLSLGKASVTEPWAALQRSVSPSGGRDEEERMTEDKALKRTIRARMTKTGESYTAARRQVLKSRAPRNVNDPGMSDASVRRGSGKGWEEWLRILDAWGGTERSHREIAGFLYEQHGISGWWAQTVTVGYERARGMRAPHQQGGRYTVNVSKTVPVSADRLFDFFADAKKRRRWLEAGTLKVRTTQPGRSARFDFEDGSTRVYAWFVPKGGSKATMTLQHDLLPNADAVEEKRSFWKERLNGLAEQLRP
jgi:hypothetical protein